jgi:hypothetical protein
MPISSSTLFHFTSDLDRVVGILENDFRPHFSLENLNVLAPKEASRPELEFAVPMVSFCDIPLSQVEKHTRAYGKYGLGLTKEWGRRNKIAPVLYTYRGSRLASRLSALAINSLTGPTLQVRQLQDSFYDLSCYVKPYEGPLERRGKTTPRYRFYDEREWRYVPPPASDLYRYGMTKAEFGNSAGRAQGNAWLWNRSRLKFAPRDIKYIIVAKEDEIVPAIHHVERGKSRFGPDQVRLLISRIVSAEQILSDF